MPSKANAAAPMSGEAAAGAKGSWHRLHQAASGWLAVPHRWQIFPSAAMPASEIPYRRSAFGTARLSSPVSKYSAREKSNTWAMRLVGMDWIWLLYVITESL